MKAKYKEIKNMVSGYVLCSIKPLYYSDVKLEPVVLPVKNGKIFNPEYQHSYIVMWTQLDLVNHYYLIKKSIHSAAKSRDFYYDIHNYKVFKDKVV